MPKIKLTCEQCGDEFFRYPAHVRRPGRGRFCSLKCQRVGTAEIRKRYGEDNAGWKGGASSYRERAIRARGARCEICGYDKYPQLLWVHHKNFKPREQQDDHSLEGLEVLCVRCHLEKHLEAGNAVQVQDPGSLDVCEPSADGSSLGLPHAEHQVTA